MGELMHADICEPHDEVTLARFKDVLQSLGAELTRNSLSSLAVELGEFKIGEAKLLVFADSLSVDIEGPPE
jgi:hypothetical protein